MPKFSKDCTQWHILHVDIVYYYSYFVSLFVFSVTSFASRTKHIQNKGPNKNLARKCVLTE